MQRYIVVLNWTGRRWSAPSCVSYFLRNLVDGRLNIIINKNKYSWTFFKTFLHKIMYKNIQNQKSEKFQTFEKRLQFSSCLYLIMYEFFFFQNKNDAASNEN